MLRHHISLLERYAEFRAGWRVVGILLQSLTHGKPRVTWPSPSGAFYPLGWWWEGEHILVPQLIEEERIAAQLEETFGDAGTSWTWGDGVKVRPGNSVKVRPAGSMGIGTVAPGTSLAGTITYSSGTESLQAVPLIAHDSYSEALVVTPPGGPMAGYWKWESVKIGTTTAPSPVRQWLLKTLIGMTYSPEPKAPSAPTKSSSPTPLSVLESYLS